jgi:sec-independent protein translocase protein TatA
MGSLSIWHWALVILVVVLLFGRGKISDLMGDVAKGIKSFKKGMADDETQGAQGEPKSLEQAADAAKPAERLELGCTAGRAGASMFDFGIGYAELVGSRSPPSS